MEEKYTIGYKGIHLYRKAWEKFAAALLVSNKTKNLAGCVVVLFENFRGEGKKEQNALYMSLIAKAL